MSVALEVSEPEVVRPSQAALWSLLLSSILATTGIFAVGVVLPRIAAAFADQPHIVILAQLVGGSTGLAFAIGSPIAGKLVERFGFRNVYVVSLIAFALIGVIPIFLQNIYWIIAARFVLGFAIAGAMTAGMTGLAKLPAAQRGRMFGRNTVINVIGALLLFPFAGFLAGINWRMAFLIHLIAVPIIPLAVMLPATKPASPEALARAGGLLGGAPLSLVLLSGFMGMAMCLGPMFAAFFLASIGIHDPKLVSIPLSVMSLTGFGAALAYAKLYARLGSQALFGLVLLLNGVGLLVAGMAPSLAIFIVGMGAVSIGQSTFFPTMGAYLSEICAGRPSRALGISMSALFAAQAIFPFISGLLMQFAGTALVYLAFGAISSLLFLVYGNAVLKALRMKAPAALKT